MKTLWLTAEHLRAAAATHNEVDTSDLLIEVILEVERDYDELMRNLARKDKK